MPSYRTVTAVVRRLDPALRILAHDGPEPYRETFDLLYRREAARPNEIWQADHTPLDIWVLDEQGKSVRPWLTVILDDYSRAVASYRLSMQAPSAYQTALTLREAIWRKTDPRWHVCGIPETFYTDHGGDFQTVNQLFLSAQPGYAPRGIPRPQPSLPLADFAGRLQAFLLDDYHHRVHRETGVAPQERWEAGGFLPRMPDSLEQLDLLLLTVAKPRRIQQDGIHLQGLRYLDLTLAAYVGESVVIRYDPTDLGEIRVYHEGRFLCREVCQELADRTISLKEIVQARTQRRRQVGTDLKERTRVLDVLLARQPTEAETAPAPAEPRRPRLKRYHNE